MNDDSDSDGDSDDKIPTWDTVGSDNNLKRHSINASDTIQNSQIQHVHQIYQITITTLKSLLLSLSYSHSYIAKRAFPQPR